MGDETQKTDDVDSFFTKSAYIPKSAQSIESTAHVDIDGRHRVPLEKWTIGALACVAALMFFFPLVSIRVPIIGEQNISGYDLVSKMGPFSNTATPRDAAQPPQETSQSTQPASGTPVPVFAVLAVLGGVFIFATFACALLMLLNIRFDMHVPRRVSTAGAALGLVAILYIFGVNIALHRALQQPTGGQDNAFTALGVAFANAVQLYPGSGLYVLVIALAVVAVLERSKILRRPGLAEECRDVIKAIAITTRQRVDEARIVATTKKSVPPAPGRDVASQLLDLARLRDQGVVDDAEFQRVKAEILRNVGTSDPSKD